MFQSLRKLTVAAWITAALVVCPVLSAMECHRCCNPQLAVNAQPTCHVNRHVAAHRPACCRPVTSENPLCKVNRCSHCPKCELNRLSPAVVQTDLGWKPFDVATLIVQFEAACVLPGPHASSETAALFSDFSTPPPRLLFCKRQE